MVPRFGVRVLGGADFVRSHEPVLADGVTPYNLGLKLDGFQHVAVTSGLKYHFRITRWVRSGPGARRQRGVALPAWT